MTTYPIPDRLAHKYHGSGYGLAASLNGQLIDFLYLADALPNFSGDRSQVVSALNDPRLSTSVRHLQALGDVHAGMISAWEFCEL